MPCQTVDDGAFYFDEKIVDAREHHGPLSTTASVVRGLTAFADVTSGSLNVSKMLAVVYGYSCYYNFFFSVKLSPKSLDSNLQIPGDKILGLAKFFLSVGIPGDAKDFFNQVYSLACLESNRQVFAWKCSFVHFFTNYEYVMALGFMTM